MSQESRRVSARPKRRIVDKLLDCQAWPGIEKALRASVLADSTLSHGTGEVRAPKKPRLTDPAPAPLKQPNPHPNPSQPLKHPRVPKTTQGCSRAPKPSNKGPGRPRSGAPGRPRSGLGASPGRNKSPGRPSTLAPGRKKSHNAPASVGFRRLPGQSSRHGLGQLVEPKSARIGDGLSGLGKLLCTSHILRYGQIREEILTDGPSRTELEAALAKQATKRAEQRLAYPPPLAALVSAAERFMDRTLVAVEPSRPLVAVEPLCPLIVVEPLSLIHI
eukprot:TRINITY_DN44483_c0_g1_i2.p1 TRINITY_DN44483_c0_g1~~TRINITY_DN44483_c0_g1_i2.p1  ORF type:complete len:275 (-),score=0.16 TRINITY_DN44483_c0_g1_i2:179-1003(-)